MANLPPPQSRASSSLSPSEERAFKELATEEKCDRILQVLEEELCKEQTQASFKAVLEHIFSKCTSLLKENNISAAIQHEVKYHILGDIHDNEKKKYIEFLNLSRTDKTEAQLVHNLYKHADMNDLARVYISATDSSDLNKVQELLLEEFKPGYSSSTGGDTLTIPFLERMESSESHTHGQSTEIGHGESAKEPSWDGLDGVIVQLRWEGFLREIDAPSTVFSPLRVAIRVGTAESGWNEVERGTLRPVHVRGRMRGMRILLKAFRGTTSADVAERKNTLVKFWQHCREGDAESIRDMDVGWADSQIPDWNGNTGLHVACIFGRSGVVDLLLGKHFVAPYKAGARTRNHLGDTPLHIAASVGNDEIVARLLADLGDDVRTDQDWRGDTALHLACVWNRVAVVRLLRSGQSGRSYTYMKNRDGLTAFRVAWELGNADAADELHHNVSREDLAATDCSGKTVLHFAARNNLGNLVNVFLDEARDAKLDARDYAGYTALHYAAQHGHRAIVQLLVEAGADMHAWTPRRETPAALAARFSRRDAEAWLNEKVRQLGREARRRDGSSAV